MFSQGWNVSDPRLLSQLGLPTAELARIFGQNKGTRVGESTVISQKMHTYQPNRPEIIQIMQDVDAGQAFYHRRTSGEVYHLDIFHERGMVDHHDVAKFLRQAVESYNFQYRYERLFFVHNEDCVNPDCLDIQTGTGGGRITGSLTFGKKASLRRAHENHVHVACILSSKHLAALFFIVLNAEQAIMRQGLELRRNEGIMHVAGRSDGQADLSAYSDLSDSFLKEKNPDPPAGDASKFQFQQDAKQLMDNFDNVKEMRDFLHSVGEGSSVRGLNRKLTAEGNSADTLTRLSGMGIIDLSGKNVRLTEYGQQLVNFLDRHLPDLEASLRRSLRLALPLDLGVSGCDRQHMVKGAGQRSTRRAVPLLPENNTRLLAPGETVQAAAARSLLAGRSQIRIIPQDLRVYEQRKQRRTEICLMVDASASMAGQRLQAAKSLVRHLLVATPDKVSVILFRENWARVQVPFTRDFNQVEQQLKGMDAFGSTPLALGLRAGIEYLEQSHAKNPLMMLITDGMPTFGEGSGLGPAEEALAAAKKIREKGYDFTCFGLRPERDFLRELAQTAGGTMYILDELEKQSLLRSAWTEYAGH